MTAEIATLLSLLVLAAVNQVLIPAPTDLVMLGLALVGVNPFGLILFVITGSSMGAAVDFYIGRFGIEAIPFLKKETGTRSYRKAEHFYKKYGYWTLLFTFFPFIGKYFPFVAGIFKASPWKVIFLYVLGKLLYYGAALTVLYSLNILR